MFKIRAKKETERRAAIYEEIRHLENENSDIVWNHWVHETSAEWKSHWEKEIACNEARIEELKNQL